MAVQSNSSLKNPTTTTTANTMATTTIRIEPEGDTIGFIELTKYDGERAEITYSQQVEGDDNTFEQNRMYCKINSGKIVPIIDVSDPEWSIAGESDIPDSVKEPLSDEGYSI